MRFKPPTLLSYSYGGDSFIFKNRFISKFCHHTIVVGHGKHLWNHQGTPLVFGLVSTIELDDFIQEFNNLCDMQQMCNPQLFTPFITWKVCFNIWKGHQWMITKSLNVPIMLILKSSDYTGHPTMCLLLNVHGLNSYFDFKCNYDNFS